MSNKKLAHFSPGRTFFLSIFATIVIGTLLLALPAARTTSIAFIDLFFTATSATCVTGLFTVPLENFTTFGHCILLILIQIGGLGLITLSLFLMSLFVNLGMATQLMAGQILELESWENIKKILVFIICITIVAESLGALSIYSILQHDYPTSRAWFLAIFHAVSSFCNAGITLFSDGLNNYGTNHIMLLTTTALMFIGSLGFVTWFEIMQYCKATVRRKRYAFSLHSKIIMYGSITLIVASVMILWLLEYNNSLANLSFGHALNTTLFQAVSYKSAGFAIGDINELHLATLFLISMIGFIGSAPGSTGSGIKITTLAIFLATMKAAISGKTSVEIKGRRIVVDQIYKAIAIVLSSLAWIALTTFFLLITEKNWHFMDLFFETVSAFATLGLSTGVTASLSLVGKIFIILSMIIGRIGSLSLIIALKKATDKKTEQKEFLYPEERVMLT